MSSAAVHRTSETDTVDRMINRTVKALMAIRDMDPPTFMAAADLNKATYYNRMKLRSGWTAVEVKRAADALGVDVGTLYEGLPVQGTWAPRGSNPQPTVLRLLPGWVGGVHTIDAAAREPAHRGGRQGKRATGQGSAIPTTSYVGERGQVGVLLAHTSSEIDHGLRKGLAA